MDQRLEPLPDKDYLSVIQNSFRTNSMIDVEIIKQTFAAASYEWAIPSLKADQPVIPVLYKYG